MNGQGELDLAARIAALVQASDIRVPDGTSVAVFVFREEAETQILHTGFVSEAPLESLRRWLKVWRKGGAPSKMTVQ